MKVAIQLTPCVGSGFDLSVHKVVDMSFVPRVGDTIWFDGGEYDGSCGEVTSVDLREYKNKFLTFIYVEDCPEVVSFDEETLRDCGWNCGESIGNCEELMLD